MRGRTAAIVTVGSELVEGLRLDTNTAEIARALAPRGFAVAEATSVGDDPETLAAVLARLCSAVDLVVVTGGLGPTHDDITRDAAATALGLPLVVDDATERFLDAAIARHRDPEAAAQVRTQALVLEGAEVIAPTTGTAPGQIVTMRSGGGLVLLPGPPSEMRPMLEASLSRFPLVRSLPRELGVVGLTESDAQVLAQRSLASHPGVALTVLARPGDVRVLLLDDGAGTWALDRAADAVREALGAHCYAADGSTLAEATLRAASVRDATIAVAESCTGGLVAAALTDVAGASAHFLGGVVAYDNRAKEALLGVPEATLAEHGAVSEQTARAMATGARERLGADHAVATTGIAGPDGGSPDKPVGLVWFAVATPDTTTATERRFAPTSREAVRLRATSTALDLLRRSLLDRH